MNLVALKRVADERSSAVERVLRELVRTEAYFGEHREEAVATVAEKLKTDADQLGKVLDDIELDVALSHALIVALEDEARGAIDNKLTDVQGAPEFEQLIAADAMRTVKPTAVTIID